MLNIRLLSVATIAVVLMGCSDGTGGGQLVPGRWYTPSQVQQGKLVFQANCASCHGNEAQGTMLDWRKTLADGSYPPPPLNGTAHAWHHPMSVLLRTIREGGIRLGGKMPGFGQSLSEEQQLAAIAFFQSHWTEDIYKEWMSRGGPQR